MSVVPTSTSTDSRFVNRVFTNTKSDLIEITDDKLKIILSEFIARIKKTNDWLIPFSIFLTLIITFLTTEFSKDFLGISRSFWSTFFILIFFISLIWLIISAINCINKRRLNTLDNLIDQIKNGNEA